jgi:hypothetical protein
MLRPAHVTAMTLGLALALGPGGLTPASRALGDETEPVVEPPEQFQPRIMEGYPDWYIERLAARERKIIDDLGARRNALGVRAGLILLNTEEWKPGSVITVAFNGGTPRLHALIERIASVWSQYGNIRFDFGRDASGHYRTWSPTDIDYKADIRVGFLPGGFWSAIGRYSINPDLNQPGNETLNLEGYDRSLPYQFARHIRHEFGHALGLEHEHQSPVVACDYRWDDDPGYVRTTDKSGQFVVDGQGRRPGIYTWFGGPPNNWSKTKIDFQLRQLTTLNPDIPVADYSMGQFDNLSIMKYHFDDWMYVSGKNSPCYSPGENYELSAEDEKRIAMYYPVGGAVAMTRQVQKKAAIESVLTQIPQSSLLAKELQARKDQLQ